VLKNDGDDDVLENGLEDGLEDGTVCEGLGGGIFFGCCLLGVLIIL